MFPYRIGRVLKPFSDNGQEAYGHSLEFLHKVCEIRNVFHLDVNIFKNYPKEASACPHSLNMRMKTHEKFLSTSLPMLINATKLYHEQVEKLAAVSTERCN